MPITYFAHALHIDYHFNYAAKIASGRQVAHSVERRTLEAEARGSKPVLGNWWLGQIAPNQPFPKGAAPAATTLLAKW